MNMRDLINIVEAKGDSQADLDALAKKYVGPNYRWDDTHYKNILYQVQPPTEMFKLAQRLDGGQSAEVTAQLFNDSVNSWHDIAEQACKILGWDGTTDQPVPPMTLDYYTELANGLVDRAFAIDDPNDDDTYYVIDTGPTSALIFRTILSESYLVASAIGNAAAVLQYLKKYRAEYERSHPLQ